MTQSPQYRLKFDKKTKRHEKIEYYLLGNDRVGVGIYALQCIPVSQL